MFEERDVFAQNISPQFVGHVLVDHEQSRKSKSAYSFRKRINGFVPVLMIFSEFPLRYFFRFGIIALLASLVFLFLDLFQLTEDLQVANVFLILSVSDFSHSPIEIARAMPLM